ncbi:MAG: methionine--tRNA ligase [Candidatus Omnitrophica bacterium]|nr:methionine--tRNA ligase [Candidatus Omnitrophota bacterium]
MEKKKMTKKFYLTTPIYYVNDKPHIGHAYTTILADVLSRFHRNLGDEVLFLTGLDEHGQKVLQAAQARNMTPQDHCDDLAPRFTQLWEKLEISNDDFIRTTQERHKKVVQAVLQMVYDKGDIYQSEYEGWYSVAEERFITETEKDSGEFRDVKLLKERNWFFKMSKYQQALIDHINAHPEYIQPEHRKNEILGFLRQPLTDLCISRPKSRMGWGIEIPFDNEYVTYVWFDALINYITAPGYLSDDKKFNYWWPASLHLIGKDILTTHSVYWSTMLFSLGLPLPKTIFAHGWWLIGDSKMSKSVGNVVNPLDLVDEFGVDPVRYFLMREMVPGQDASFTMDAFIKRYNSDLANDFGNLLNRVSGLIPKYFNAIVPAPGSFTAEDKVVINIAESLKDKVPALVENLKVSEAIEETMQLVRAVNKYMEQQAPWKLAKENLPVAGRVLYVASEALRITAVHLSAVMPAKTKIVLDVLGAQGSTVNWGELKPGTKLGIHDALFPRITLPPCGEG